LREVNLNLLSIYKFINKFIINLFDN
jgi:hypothetical protein